MTTLLYKRGKTSRSEVLRVERDAMFVVGVSMYDLPQMMELGKRVIGQMRTGGEVVPRIRVSEARLATAVKDVAAPTN